MKQTDIEFSLKLLTHMHIGAGLSVSHEQDGETSELALTCVDHNGNAWIPGPSLKGALRDRCAQAQDVLFGVSHQKGALFARGALTVFPATCYEKPNANSYRQTAVDSGTGASRANALFQRQIVNPDVKFSAKLRLSCFDDTSDAAPHDKLLQNVLELLQKVYSEGGLHLGRNKSDNWGHFSLQPEIKLTTRELTAEGWGEPASDNRTLQNAFHITPEWQLQLHCPGPFHVFSHDVSQGNAKVQKPRRRNNKPLLDPAGISGAIRKRAEWHMAIHGLTDKLDCATTAGSEPLTLVERLFGTEGRRGTLNWAVSGISSDTDPVKMTSVSIDRFSGGSLSSALFSIEADTNVKCALNITTFRPLQDDERQFVNSLLAEICETGLELGKKTTSGFGWFKANLASGQQKNDWPDTKLPKPAEQGAVSRRDTVILQAYNFMVKQKPGMSVEGPINGQLMAQNLEPLTPDEKQNLHDVVKNIRQNAGGAIALNVKNYAASEHVRLPYRHIHVDTSRIGKPEPIVAERFADQNLHSEPLPEGFSGTLDVSWRFVRPMLVSNGDGTGMKIGKEYILPGATIRGNLRAILEAASNARMTRFADQPREKLDDTPHAFRARCAIHDQNTAIPNPEISPHTKPKAYGPYDPDFVEALFGFIHTVDDDDKPQADHAKYHLKSRLSFGMAILQGDQPKPGDEHHITVVGPDTASKIYNQLGRKRYPVDAEVPQGTQNILDNYLAPKKKVDRNAGTTSSFRFLQASAQNPLIFRGQIRFHNVTAAELGALLWAITWDNTPTRYHKIGYAKPFGAGVCVAEGLHLAVRGLADKAPQGAPFDLTGAPITQFLDAFKAHLQTEELFGTQAYYETLASATPGAAQHLDTYQLWKGYNPHPKNTLADKKDGIKSHNGHDRITAMLRQLNG